MNVKKSDQASKTGGSARRPNSTARDLAASLRDSITATDQKALAEDPEETFIDLASRLVRELHKRGLTVVAMPTREEQLDIVMAHAAARTLKIFTEWMRANPRCSYDTRMSPTGKFQVVVRTPDAATGLNATQLFFGGDIQDAYGQASTTIQASKDSP
jgi:hypothetical protein